jgi:hypothetical protein
MVLLSKDFLLSNSKLGWENKRNEGNKKRLKLDLGSHKDLKFR